MQVCKCMCVQYMCVHVRVTHVDVQVHKHTCADVPVCHRVTGEKSEDRGRRKTWYYCVQGSWQKSQASLRKCPSGDLVVFQFALRLEVMLILHSGLYVLCLPGSWHSAAPDRGLELDGRQKSGARKGCPGVHIIALAQKSAVTSWSWVV